MYALDLTCNNTVFTEIEVKEQYPKDEHWVLCPDCQDKQRVDSLAIAPGIPAAWQKVIKIRELTNVNMYHVLRESPQFVYGDRILRLQPTVPQHRLSPFPYKVRRVGFRIS